MKATELIKQLQVLVDANGDQNVGMSTVGEFATARVESVRLVDGKKYGAPGIKLFMISDYEA